MTCKVLDVFFLLQISTQGNDCQSGVMLKFNLYVFCLDWVPLSPLIQHANETYK